MKTILNIEDLWSPTTTITHLNMIVLLIVLTTFQINSTDKMNPSQEIKKQRQIEASPQNVWNILTHPDNIEKWLYGTRVKTDWKPGSDIIFSFTWNGKEYNDKGTVLEFETEKRFSYNYWSGLSGIPDKPENYSVITFELEPDDTGTLLNLTHTNFATETMYEHSDRNWEEALDLIKTLCEQ